MDANSASNGNHDADWNTDDELEVCNESFSHWGSTSSGQEANEGFGEASSPTNSTKLIHDFVGMGFSKTMVVKAIEENGEDDSEAILETLLAYAVVKNFPQEEGLSTKPCTFDSKSKSPDNLSEIDSCPGIEENSNHILEKDTMLSSLVDMGYLVEEALTAMNNCGSEAQLSELTDYIYAAQMVKDFDAQLRESPDEEDSTSVMTSYSYTMPRNDYLPREKKRKLHQFQQFGRKWHKGSEKKHWDEDGYIMHLPNPMIGFGIPDDPWPIVERKLPEVAIGPPYFYYENVALTPKGVWSKISRFLYDIEPEFVDSKHFSAAARKRGYVHNLPIQNRFPLLPIPPRTIQEALPLTNKWWPLWDKRTKLNCLQTAIGTAKLTERIRNALENNEKYGDEPPPHVQKFVLEQCRKWNLVWVGKNKVAPLEPDEMETLLGFPRDHTRGGGISRKDRYKALGNSFQVDTVAYHLSVVKNLFPNGINLLSLFSGIGGAEVALHRLGIPLKNVVSVEIAEVNRNIIRSWWEQTNQRGQLIEIADVQQVSIERLGQWISSFGGFDLVIGGSPCNNLAGSNRVSRNGLDGKHSSLFYHYVRILDLVKTMMGRDR
ncbi:hypothetical protein RGQ29_015518 [Quercus rubra]|uniref:DNA (cytosine-5-)-methyltransferase n=1 Tax=Quercus rubra TaxID=3512 RepID=A0AAN7J4U7_QUERU|nr:hypothetical protein RGQ29_015518 [Quercus rubra]